MTADQPAYDSPAEAQAPRRVEQPAGDLAEWLNRQCNFFGGSCRSRYRPHSTEESRL
jgi:hypothetical protein